MPRRVLFAAALALALAIAVLWSFLGPRLGPGLREDQVLAIAETVLQPRFPDSFEGCKPYRARLEDGVWHVFGTLPPGWIGGTPEARIRRDGVVLEVYHTQ